jgi:ligand-binding SRPBCC domain-containing protein
MKLILTTHVKESFKVVFSRFDLNLFKALKPPLMPLKVERFDGCKVNDEVHLNLGFTRWVSLITESVETEEYSYFVDEGQKLPFPLTYWRHKHLIKKAGPYSLIIDDIEFKTILSPFDGCFYPILWCMFKLRGPVYQHYFGAVS